MNAAIACAPEGVSLKADQWKYNWKALENNVKKLQMRIVKAQQAGKHNKVRALQWLITHSLSAKILAVKRVTENSGKNTPGTDGILWKTDRDRIEAVRELKRAGYKAEPLRRVYIPKKNGQKRGLGIPTMKDRAQQALYLQALEPVAETILDNDTYGFRKGRSTADAIEAIFKATTANADCAEWVIEGDIRSCFDRIDHEWLMKNIPLDKKMMQQWLKAGIVFNKEVSSTEAGTPQGGIISPCLANLALNGLGSLLHERFMKQRKTIKRKTINNKVHTIVYADDFIVTGKSREFLEQEVLPLIREFMKERGLELSEEKTTITHIAEGFDFLGQKIRKYKGKVLVKPSKKNIKSFLDNIRELILRRPAIKQADIIGILNPKIRGWCNYHRHVVSKKIFSYVDYQVYKALWQWCTRRHPKKSKYWIKNKYFKVFGRRNWVFAAEKDGKVLELYRADSTQIVRHTKIQREANPYATEWQMYFEEREGEKMFNNMNKRKQLVRMWKRQGRKCPVCGDEINKASSWRLHLKTDGSKPEMVHPLCHKMIHSNEMLEGAG